MGCCSSSPAAQDAPAAAKPKPVPKPPAAHDGGAPPVAAEQKEAVLEAPAAAVKDCTVYVVYYSMYGHVEKLALAAVEGIKSSGAKVECYRVPEILPDEILEKMKAPAKNEEHPILSPADLVKADAFVFAFPTRFGMMCSQMKSFFDATGGLWSNGALAGKPASLMVSTGTQGGGQETTLLTAATQLAHHGIIFVPPGYTAGDKLFGLDKVRGGGPWGSGTFAGADGARQPSSEELELAQHQGELVAKVAAKLC